MVTQQLSAQQRGMLFGQATRQTIHGMPTQQIKSEQESVQFLLPKTRLLSKIYLEVEATATLTTPTGSSIALDTFSPYQILRRVSLDLNTGFSPFIVTGRDLFLYNVNRLNPNILLPGTSKRGMNYVENGANTTGVDAKIKFMVELSVSLNDRDPVGLLLLQNPETQLTLTVDTDVLAKAYKPTAGQVVAFKNMSITPVLETFTIPPVPDAMPDISVLKLVQSRSEAFAGNGQSTIKLHTGTIYRKLIVYLEDTSGNPILDSDFAGNLDIVFNQADTPYSVKPSILSARNASQLGYALPDGVYIFDWSNQGLPNLGGSRDYVDSERLVEFWIRFSTVKAGKITVVSETLSRLR